jgi:hypothetical protein
LILGIDFLCLESINETLENIRTEFSIAIPAQCRWQNVELLLTHLLPVRWINDVKRTHPLWLPDLLFDGRKPKDLQGRLTNLPGALTVSGSEAGAGGDPRAITSDTAEICPPKPLR